MFIQCVAVGRCDILNCEHYLPVLNPGKSSRRDVIGTVLRHENQVGMGHAIPMDDHSHSLRLKHLPHPPPDALGHEHNALGSSVLDVRKMVDMGERDYRALPGRRGMNGHESHNQLVPIDDTGG